MIIDSSNNGGRNYSNQATDEKSKKRVVSRKAASRYDQQTVNSNSCEFNMSTIDKE